MTDEIRREIRLKSQGRISKKDFELGYRYFDKEGKELEFPSETNKGKDINFQPSSKYYKVRRAGAGDVIYRERKTRCYALNGVVEGKREGREYELTQTIYLHTALDEDEAERLLKRVWNEKTDFAPYKEFLTETNLTAEEIPKVDTFMIKSTYKEGGQERNYFDKAEAKVTMKSLILDDFIQERESTGKTDNSGTRSFKRMKL